MDDIFDESRRTAGNGVSTADQAKAGASGAAASADDGAVGRGKIRAALWDELFSGEYEDLIVGIPNMFGNKALPAKNNGEDDAMGTIKSRTSVSLVL